MGQASSEGQSGLCVVCGMGQHGTAQRGLVQRSNRACFCSHACSSGVCCTCACFCVQTCAALVGKPLDQGTLAECLQLVQKDVAISDNAPGGKVRACRGLCVRVSWRRM